MRQCTKYLRTPHNHNQNDSNSIDGDITYCGGLGLAMGSPHCIVITMRKNESGQGLLVWFWRAEPLFVLFLARSRD